MPQETINVVRNRTTRQKPPRTSPRAAEPGPLALRGVQQCVQQCLVEPAAGSRRSGARPSGPGGPNGHLAVSGGDRRRDCREAEGPGGHRRCPGAPPASLAHFMRVAHYSAGATAPAWMAQKTGPVVASRSPLNG